MTNINVTPPPPTVACSPPGWCSRGQGEGPSKIGQASRFATTLTNTLKDFVWPITLPNPNSPVSRTKLMTTGDYHRILTGFKQIKSDLHFSTFLATTPIQNLDEEFVRGHFRDMMIDVSNPETATWIFAIQCEPTTWLGVIHMTFLIIADGQLEFYDPAGFYMAKRSWNANHSLEAVANIAHEILIPKQPYKLTNVTSLLQQTDTRSCGHYTIAYIHHHFILKKSIQEWKEKLKTTSETDIRKEVAQWLNNSPSDSTSVTPEPTTPIRKTQGSSNSLSSMENGSQLARGHGSSNSMVTAVEEDDDLGFGDSDSSISPFELDDDDLK